MAIDPDSKLAKAKAAIDIYWLWDFYRLDGKPNTGHSRTCYSPFREDRKPSFSVFDDGRRWKDFATDEHGDQADFVAQAEGLDSGNAIRRLIEIWETGTSEGQALKKKRPAKKKRKKRKVSYDLLDMNQDKIDQIIASRKLPEGSGSSLWELSRKGMLFNFKDDEREYWAITDDSRNNIQVRRYDGEPIELDEGRTVKSKTLPGTRSAWPIGLKNVLDADVIQFTEGGPDFLCAKVLADKLESSATQVCFTGSSNRIPEQYLSYFEGKRVVIYQHSDLAGFAATRLWRSQLSGIAQVFVLRMSQYKWGVDLNDMLTSGAIWKFRKLLERQLRIDESHASEKMTK